MNAEMSTEMSTEMDTPIAPPPSPPEIDHMDLRRYIHASIAPDDATPNGRRYGHFGALRLFADPRHGDDANVVIVLSNVDPEELFARAAAFFGAARRYRVELDLQAAPEVDAALRARGWQLDDEEPAMVLQPLEGIVIPPVPRELSIRQVTTQADLDAFCALSRTGARWIPSLAAATAPGVAVFVGSVDGVDVATSRVKVKGDPRVVDINGITTQPNFRRRGYGTAMTWQTVRFGLPLGAEAAVLSASRMGYSVYLKMGFVPVCTFRAYVPPAPNQSV